MIQIGFIFLLLYSTCILVKILFFIPSIGSSSSPPPPSFLIEGLPGEVRHVVGRSKLRDPAASTLLDIKNFTLRQEPREDLCSVDDLLFLVIVHSKPDHFLQRSVIRSTWGSLKRFSDVKDSKSSWSVRVVFILGQSEGSNDENPSVRTKPSLQSLIHKESQLYGDLLEGSFTDIYHNLRYKHILGIRYGISECANAVFFLKADDDAFIDIPGLYRYLNRTFGPISNSLRNIMAGNVFPRGTKPQREGKWKVPVSEYPWDEYPSYLGGLAYLMTPDVAKDLHKIAHNNIVPEIWVDDVWVTGLLANTLQIQPLYMNPRYSYDHAEMAEWVKRANSNNQRLHPPPYTFSHLDPSQSNWEDIVQSLWKRIRMFYKLKSGQDTSHDANTISGGVR